MSKLIIWIETALKVLNQGTRRIIWNSFLAFIPLILSLWLFRLSNRRTWLWWAILVIFLAFLPNAPYVLTDTIHVIEAARRGYSVWIITLVLIPQYFIFILAGFEAYVLSLMNVGYYLHKQGLRKYIFPTELTLHALSAIGIYLGRFKRFNSWDFITQPDELAMSVVNDLTAKQPIFVMFITFIILTVLYWLVKQVTLSVIFRIRYAKTLQQQLLNE
ncbi:MAG: DUF1361 domain-containing protein [Oscillatoria sp. PMC 1051.18]|nr:DUF1361 domain-containing protein [Oscillatoria sp. PMC 1050.18]MEC5028650.1 DUF1361 domain-containing protein [Oscillatoria sp. PMC 1051.18]MEC5033050.1 DUF1361 domain-containing protein [Oscillatoria sp. PMC 1051.18]